MHYLTLQDIIWLNLHVTKRVNRFSFSHLEDAAFYQYGYGKSTDLFRQAGQLLRGFVRHRPFTDGNEATAFFAFATFLELNGRRLKIADAEVSGWVKRFLEAPEADVPRLVEEATEPSERHHPEPEAAPPVKPIVQDLLERYPQALAALRDPAVAAEWPPLYSPVHGAR